MLDVWGTVRWMEAAVSGFFLRDVEASVADRSLGSFGVGLKRSGCAICASSVS
jgi:hypothetical protein